MAGLKYGEFSFPKEFGFHGSAGKSQVSGYMRTAYKSGGHVKKGTTLTRPDNAKEPHYPGAPVNYRKGGHADKSVRGHDADKVHEGKVHDRFEGDDMGYKHGGTVKHKYASGGGVDPKVKPDRFERGATPHEMSVTDSDKREHGLDKKEERTEEADQHGGISSRKGGKVRRAAGGRASTPQRYAFGGMSRAPGANKAIHAKTHKPTAGMRGLGALGQAAGPSMAPLGAPPGGAPGMTPQPLGGAPMGMKRGGHSHR